MLSVDDKNVIKQYNEKYLINEYFLMFKEKYSVIELRKFCENNDINFFFIKTFT